MKLFNIWILLENPIMTPIMNIVRNVSTQLKQSTKLSVCMWLCLFITGKLRPLKVYHNYDTYSESAWSRECLAT